MSRPFRWIGSRYCCFSGWTSLPQNRDSRRLVITEIFHQTKRMSRVCSRKRNVEATKNNLRQGHHHRGPCRAEMMVSGSSADMRKAEIRETVVTSADCALKSAPSSNLFDQVRDDFGICIGDKLVILFRRSYLSVNSSMCRCGRRPSGRYSRGAGGAFLRRASCVAKRVWNERNYRKGDFLRGRLEIANLPSARVNCSMPDFHQTARRRFVARFKFPQAADNQRHHRVFPKIDFHT